MAGVRHGGLTSGLADSSSNTESMSTPAMKENTGASAKKRRQQRIFIWASTAFVSYVVVMLIYEAHFAGYWVSNVTVDESGRARIRRRPAWHYKRLQPDKKTTPEDAVVEGYHTLIDLQIPQSGLAAKDRYAVRATFCQIDWHLQQVNPSTVPMFRDLVDKSVLCDSTTITVDLFDIVQRAKEYDASFATNSSVVQVVSPSGVVFHETRCGSTLFANLLAAFSPTNSRVYSESPPPVAALSACNNKPCNPALHLRLVQDVFYMMGRTTRNEMPQYVFYKIQSIGVMNIEQFASALPNIPWVYLFRDSVEVMQSHLGEKNGANLASRTPVCARYYGRGIQPKTTLKVIEGQDRDVEDLSKVEYCAAHLAGLSLAAMEEHKRTERGRFVNYAQMPAIVWEDILPNYFNIPQSKKGIVNMEKAALVYSKGRGGKANQEWVEDSKKKKVTAVPAVVKAAKTFLGDIYNDMDDLASPKK
jgi:hypothetical protein